MRGRGHSDGEKPSGEQSPSKTQKSFTGKGKGRARPPSPEPSPAGGAGFDLEESRTLRPGEGSSSLHEQHRPAPLPLYDVDELYYESDQWGRRLRNKKIPRVIVEPMHGKYLPPDVFVSIPSELIPILFHLLPLSRLLMIRSTCTFFCHALPVDETGVSTGKLLWQYALASLAVSMPAGFVFGELIQYLSETCSSNKQRLYQITEIACRYYGTRLGEMVSSSRVKFYGLNDLFPEDHDDEPPLVPRRLEKWLGDSARSRRNPMAPTNCVATLQSAGFFSTSASRACFIEALTANREVFRRRQRRKHRRDTAKLIDVYSFFIDLAAQSFELQSIRVSSVAWANGWSMRSRASMSWGPGVSIEDLVGVRREDVDALNLKYGLGISFITPNF
jgi:hypothetical protein